jgi:hypothetical protein
MGFAYSPFAIDAPNTVRAGHADGQQPPPTSLSSFYSSHYHSINTQELAERRGIWSQVRAHSRREGGGEVSNQRLEVGIAYSCGETL